jgi:pSer/pThr/pTyr-binding forkhead associated (FHA) protein
MSTLASFQRKLQESLPLFRKKYPAFEEAYSTYTSQYGDGSIRIHEPFKINNTIDPVIIVLGRTTPLFYRDSRRTLTGTLASVEIQKGVLYILGRREPVDSKLIVWSKDTEVEIERFDSRVRIVPSRVHAGILADENGDVLFDDLGSSSGSILAGETSKPDPFITLYATPRVGIHRVELKSKYAT